MLWLFPAAARAPRSLCHEELMQFQAAVASFTGEPDEFTYKPEYHAPVVDLDAPAKASQ